MPTLNNLTSKTEIQKNLPGKFIPGFAFALRLWRIASANPPYSFVYTGTHDNDTTLGWSLSISDYERNYVYDYLGNPSISMHCALVQAALGSVANLAVIPMQDILELDSEARMNTPGTTEGNWKWRFQWHQLSAERAARLGHLVKLFLISKNLPPSLFSYAEGWRIVATSELNPVGGVSCP